MKLMDALFAKAFQRRAVSKKKPQTGEALLCVSVSDSGWTAELTDSGRVCWKQQQSSDVERSVASPAEQLAQAIARFSAEQPQADVVRVVLLIDDPDLQLVDHRFAKLGNFEPRALKEFGSQQSGGRPAVFGSLAYGASSAREIEKRILGFLPEEKLETCFFALGKMATALAGVVPAAANALQAEAPDGGIFASLRVHGYFSNLLIANAETGIVASRQFAFGSLTLANAYAAEHGLSLALSSAALRLRNRLPSAAAVKEGAAPEHKTGTFIALAPSLRELHDDIAATIEFFRFQRLAGRPAHLSLTFTGPTLAGLDTWLAEALDLQVEIAANAVAAPTPEAPALNLLEGSRAGLLKMGNQPFEFSKGRFLPIKGAIVDAKASKSISGMMFNRLEKLAARFGVRQFAVGHERLMVPLGAAGLIGALVFGNMFFLTGPAVTRLARGANAYSSAASSSIARPKPAGETGPSQDERPVMWADSLFAVSRAILPDMKLERLELGAAAGKTGASAFNLAITGALTSGGPGNLKTVADFIDRLSKDAVFSQQFPQVQFTGAGETRDETRHAMAFHVAAQGGAAR
jgi:hypothetical protein